MRHTRKKGGRFYGKGTFGAVMGDPRFPCLDETVDEIKDNNEVGKIFTNHDDFLEEDKLMYRLNAVLTKAQIDKLKDYLILPTKSCLVDLAKAKNTDIYKEDDWYKDMHGNMTRDFAYRPHINKFTIDGRSLDRLYQISYPRAEDSMVEVIAKYQIGGYQKKDLYIALKHICELYKGVQEIQKLDLIHGDIKSQNAVIVDGKAKFIDVAQMTQVNIDEPENKKGFLKLCEWMAYNSGYFPWSELVVFALTEETSNNTLSIVDSYDHTIGNYGNSYSFDYLIEQIQLWMRIFSDNRLKLDEEVRKNLESQFIKICVARLYGITGMNKLTDAFRENAYDLRNVKDVIEYLLARSGRINISYFDNPMYPTYNTSHPEYVVRAIRDFKLFVNKLNTAFYEGVADDTFRMKRMDYIFKMNDIHSMGVMMMEFLKFVRPAGIDDEMKPIVKKALEVGIVSLQQLNPFDVPSYYENRNIHFQEIFNIADELLADIQRILNPVAPSVHSRRSSRRSSHRSSHVSTPRRVSTRKVKSVKKSATRRKTRRHSR